MSTAGVTTSIETDIELGWPIYHMTVGDLDVRVVPRAGCNVFSIRHQGEEILRQPQALRELPGTKHGVPILYPTPNRVRDSIFTFCGREFQFTPNNNANFIHGLVHSAPWEVVEFRELVDRRGVASAAAELECRIVFGPGHVWFDLFPLPHIVNLVIRVADSSVRWTYCVDNTLGTAPVPFGFGLHPWFVYQGPRSETWLTVPATHWMQAIDLVPTGRLIDLSRTAIDLRQARSLEGFFVDDVYFGMAEDRPAVIEHRAAGRKVTLSASSDFTHAVVYTPADKDAFCVENQTCSTDAHNLFARELAEAAHLIVVPPGETHRGHVAYEVERRK